METNAYLLLTPDKIGIYLTLGLCGLLVMLLALHAQRRFRRASSPLATLNVLNKEWEEAQSKFFEAADQAKERIGELNLPQREPAFQGPAEEIGLELRNHVMSMAKRGAGNDEIARSAGLTEAEVDVMLGMARIGQDRKN